MEKKGDYELFDEELLADFLPIPLESIRAGSLANFDIYIRVNEKFVLYRGSNLPFTVEVKHKLLKLQAKTLFIKAIHIDNYLEHLEAHLDEAISRQDLPADEKAKMVYTSAVNSMQAFLASPNSIRHLERVRKLASRLVNFLIEHDKSLHLLLHQMPPDFANRTHAVNVAAYVVSLAGMFPAPDPPFFEELALGAFLHDVGKTKTAVNLFAEGSREDAKLLRLHPLWGVNLLEQLGEIPSVSRQAILSHQERLDGSGYPYGLAGHKVPMVSRLMAIADVFDALGTRMPYREGMTAFEALRLMKDEMKGQFDETILNWFIMLLAGRQHPSYQTAPRTAGKRPPPTGRKDQTKTDEPRTDEHVERVEDVSRHLSVTEANLRALLLGQRRPAACRLNADSNGFSIIPEPLSGAKVLQRVVPKHEPTIVCELAPDGTTLFVSDEVTEITGYKPEELQGKNWWDIFCSGGLRCQVDKFHGLCESSDVTTLEMLLATKDSSPKALRWNFVNRHRPNGSLDSIVGFGVSVSGRTEREVGVREKAEKLERIAKETVEAIALTMEIKDPYTAGHQRRVRALAGAIAEEMGLSDEQIALIREAALVHDIGKISVPAEILNKPGPLSDAQFELIKGHPQVGRDILQKIEPLWTVAHIVYQHHERMDGSGYPSGLQGENILLEARVLGVADVVEAMAAHRPYRPGLGIEAALKEISEKKGLLYDPQVVENCLRLLEKNGFEFDQPEGTGKRKNSAMKIGDPISLSEWRRSKESPGRGFQPQAVPEGIDTFA